jgi:hypothetical protein
MSLKHLRVAAVCAALATFAGMASSSAQAATVGGLKDARMTITPAGVGLSKVTVTGRFASSLEVAQGLLQSGSEAYVQLREDDTFDDNVIVGFARARAWAATDGIRVELTHPFVSNDVLDEDWGRDEVYARVALFGPTDSILREGNTNTVTGRF